MLENASFERRMPCKTYGKTQGRWGQELRDFGSRTPMRHKSPQEGEHTSPRNGQVASSTASGKFPLSSELLPNRTTHIVEGKRSHWVPGNRQVLYRRNAMGSDSILIPNAFLGNKVQHICSWLPRWGIFQPRREPCPEFGGDGMRCYGM